MSSITKPRSGSRRRRRGGGRRGPGRRSKGLRTEAEQLDYEMELLRAQREGREEEFKAEEREKLRIRKAEQLDAEMEQYFKKKDEANAEKDADKKDVTDAKAQRTPEAPEQNGHPAQAADTAAS